MKGIVTGVDFSPLPFVFLFYIFMFCFGLVFPDMVHQEKLGICLACVLQSWGIGDLNTF